MEAEVIHLKFKSPHVEDDMMAILSCIVCKNKTFTLTDINPGVNFPLMRCAACGAHIGRMGWAHDDDPALNQPPTCFRCGDTEEGHKEHTSGCMTFRTNPNL